MTPAELAPWLLAAMRAWSPVPDGPEVARYEAFASAVATAAIATPLPSTSAEDTAILLLAIASYESGGFRADVMRCAVRGDHGASIGPFQVQRASARVCTDHVYAARVALERVAESWARCGRGELAGYTAGRCASSAGRRLSALYVGRARAWARKAPLLAAVD